MIRNCVLLVVTWFLSLGVHAEDYEHYSEWITYSEIKRVPRPYNLDFSPNAPRWSYQVGIELDGMLDVYATYGGAKLERYLKAYPKQIRFLISGLRSSGRLQVQRHQKMRKDHWCPAVREMLTRLQKR